MTVGEERREKKGMEVKTMCSVPFIRRRMDSREQKQESLVGKQEEKIYSIKETMPLLLCAALFYKSF